MGTNPGNGGYFLGDRGQSNVPEWVKPYLRRLGLTIDESIVRVVVRSLQGKTGRNTYDLWKKGRYRDGRPRTPVCHRKTVDKIERLYNEGKLVEYVEYLDSLDRESQASHADSGVGASEQPDLGEQAYNPIDVSIRTNCDGRVFKAHVSATFLNPIFVSVSVTNRGSQIIRYLQLHVWLPAGYVFWNPVTDSGWWQHEGLGEMPTDLQDFWVEEEFDWYVVRMSAVTGFFLMPSQQPFTLPTMNIICKSTPGMLPIPWRLETPREADVKGLLVLCIDRDGRLKSESYIGEVDANYLVIKRAQFLRSIGAADDTQYPPFSDLMRRG